MAIGGLAVAAMTRPYRRRPSMQIADKRDSAGQMAGKFSTVVGKRGRPMDDQQAASQPAMTKPAQEGLRRNSLNLPRLAFTGLAYFSLAPVIYLNMGFMETDSGGPVMPFLFIVITIAVLPTAISFAVLNNRRPSAGSGYTWM